MSYPMPKDAQPEDLMPEFTGKKYQVKNYSQVWIVGQVGMKGGWYPIQRYGDPDVAGIVARTLNGLTGYEL